MPFNPFTWNNGQPIGTQNISSGQTTILNDIKFLGSATGNVQPGFIQFPNGLIAQWGKTGALVSGANPLIFSTLTGMQSFINNLFIVIPVVRSSTVTGVARGVWISTSGFSITGFTLISQDTLNVGCDILAIGN
jgi:hypothetical protein